MEAASLLCADDVLIVGVERDYDCLCLGEGKATKHIKRLLAKAQGKEQRKGPVERESGETCLTVESRDVELDTCTEDPTAGATSTKPNSTRSPSERHDQADKAQSTTMQQFPHQPVAVSAYPRQLGGATPSNSAHAPLAPTTGQLTAFNEAQGGANSYGLPPAQQAAGAAASTSQPQAGDMDWFSPSDWDAFLDQLPSLTQTADTVDTGQISLATTSQHPSSTMVPKGTSTTSALAPSQAATALEYGSSSGASGSSSMNAASGAASRPALQPHSSGAGFASFADTTVEKDSATQSAASHYTQNTLFNSTTSSYPTSSDAIATSNNANPQKQDLNLSSLNAPSATQSNLSIAPTNPSVNHYTPTSITHNRHPPEVSPQPVNTFLAEPQQQQQQQQAYGTSNASMRAASLSSYQAPPTVSAPMQYHAAVPLSGGGVQGHQQPQGYPSAASTTLPNSQLQTAMNSANNAALFHPSPNSHAALVPPQQATQLQQSGINGHQLPFNVGARAIAAQSNSQTTYSLNNGGIVGGPGRPLQLPFNGSRPSLPASSSSGAGTEHLQNDEVLARKLQEDEFIKGMRRSKHGDERLAMSLLANDLSIRQARHSVPNNTTQYALQRQQFPLPPAMQITAVGGPSNFSTNASIEQPNGAVLSNADQVLGEEQQEQGPGGNMMKHPTCWTPCPNCPSEAARKYHLIDVERDSPEWNVVTQPLFNSGFSVEQVQRIQNETLWQRLCFEKQLMLRDRSSCNEKFLYHTSRAKVAVICEEGLDPRLSRNGLFGSGIYFSDNPIKCDRYWSNKLDSERTMFCCRVLLGDTKVYPKGKSEQLKREPPKENPQPGEPKTYDSVKGNVSGQDEFVVYNAYRVMPEYVIKYSSLEAEAPPPFAMRSRWCMRHRQLLARRVSVPLPYPNPHSTVHPIAPPMSLPRAPSMQPFIGYPSNYCNPMTVPDSTRFGVPPVMLPQPCFGAQAPVFQSPTPIPHFPARST